MREAADLIGAIGVYDKKSANQSSLDSVLSRWSIGRHCLLLDEALDLFISDNINSRRGTTFFGAGMSSDESPPSQPRFRGYRFQVTYVYVPYIPLPSTWMGSKYIQERPIAVEQYMVDIMHCPGKDGRTTHDVISRQLGRLGLSAWDITSGTGDGGGENEGKEGVHRIYEEKGAGYVRRRCHGHLGCVRPISCCPRHSNRRCSHCTGGTAGPRVHVRVCVCVCVCAANVGCNKRGIQVGGGQMLCCGRWATT